MIDAAAAYAEVQHRMSSLASSLSAEQSRAKVPACPDWTIHDLVAHHTAVIVDIAEGSVAELRDLARLLNQNSDPKVGRDRDAMTARQVAERRGRTIQEILDEWSGATERIMPMLRGETSFPEAIGPFGAAVAVNDIVIHEGDLHEAIGMGYPPVVSATSLAFAAYGSRWTNGSVEQDSLRWLRNMTARPGSSGMANLPRWSAVIARRWSGYSRLG